MKTLKEVYSKFSAPKDWGDKGTTHDYLGIYEKHITKRKNVTLLEIGVFFGHSIAMWNEYLEDSKVYGCDITLEHVSFDVGNLYQLDSTILTDVENAFGKKKFDYIIDDGSHNPEAQVKTFYSFWPLLKKGGTYFIEDIAGDQALSIILKEIKNLPHIVYDNREKMQRFDEILLVIFK